MNLDLSSLGFSGSVVYGSMFMDKGKSILPSTFSEMENVCSKRWEKLIID